MCFIDIKGNFFFVNREMGNTDKHDNWYSNDSYMTYHSYNSYYSRGDNRCTDCGCILFGYSRSIGYCDDCLGTNTVDGRISLSESDNIIDYVYEFNVLRDAYDKALNRNSFTDVIKMCNENFIYTTSHINKLRTLFYNRIALIKRNNRKTLK